MAVPRWFYWITALVFVTLFFMLGWGGTVLYQSENKRLQEEINAIVKQTAEAVQSDNHRVYDIRVFADQDYKEKIAFAAGMTQNQSRISMNFGEQHLPVVNGEKDKPTITTIKPTNSAPIQISASDLKKNHAPYKVQPTKKINYFDSLLTTRLKKGRIYVPYHLEAVPERIKPVPTSSGLFIINFYEPVVYRVVYTIPTSLLLTRLLPYISVATLLLLLLAGATVLYHKSYRLQLQMTQFKESLFSNVTHELKTPLSSLQLIVHAFKEGKVGLSIKQNEYIDFADKELQRMHLLIEKILSFGKLDKEQFALNKEIINMTELVSDAIRIMDITAGNRNAAIIFEPTMDYAMPGDRVLLLNMITGIIDNAIKYNADEPQVSITIGKEGGYVKLQLTDNGIGIPAQYHAKIFEPFFRVPVGNQHNVMGHGLGLSFTQQVVKLHGGKILLESIEGKGSTFTLLLPS